MRIDKTKLHLLMGEKCMTSRELRVKSGLPEGTYIKVVAGGNVRPVTAGKLAKALNVPLESLVIPDSI